MSFRHKLPLHLFRKMMCWIVALVCICATSARATIVFQDNFNRVGPLNGSTPSLTPGGNWTATSGFTTDGSKVSAAFGLSDFHGAAYVPLPVAITSGNIYTLSATTYRGLSTDDSAIMIFGFFDSLPSWNGGAVVDEGHAIAMAPRNNRQSVNTMLNGFVNASEFGVADGTNGTTFGVRLYETAPNTWSAVAVELSPTNQLILGQNSPSPISLANIASIGMISGSLLPPYIDNLTLNVTARGDVNFDSHVNAKDIAAIMQALANETGYATANGVSKLELETVGDVNFDGKFTNADLQKLLNNLKTGGGSSDLVPEPSTLALLTLGGAIAFAAKRRTKNVRRLTSSTDF